MPLWGFADLHAHPASHLGFGAEVNADGSLREYGIFWGSPGLEWHASTLSTDLAPCDADSHTVIDDGGMVRTQVRRQILETIGKLTPEHPHRRGGCCSFQGWPHARDLMHQQMHVTWVRRAWEGGLRLMIASVTDNQALAMLWHRTHGAPPKPFDPMFDFHSARAQLIGIRKLAIANAAWMEIVTTAAQARRAIQGNKLALILSLEMDTLTMEQIVALKDEFGVRHVIPIHLADNRFGGTAVYSDIFNTNNHYLTGRFYEVVGDANLRFRLARPQYLRYIGVGVGDGKDLLAGGVYKPTPIGDTEYAALRYPADRGHRNARGLDLPHLEMLMRQGLLIDIAHMSENAQESAIAHAERFRYPVMNSHTGLRPDGRPAGNERGMTRAHASRIAALGGVIGLGTAREDYPTSDPVRSWAQEYLDALAVTRGRGIALGTDMNGLVSQIPFSRSSTPVSYPIRVARAVAAFLGRDDGRELPLMRVMDKAFNFADVGIAQYGLLPDFLQAVYNTLAGDGRDANRLVGQLYETAEQTVQMWERVEAAAATMRVEVRRPNMTAFDLFWSSARRDNFSTATAAGRSSARSAGYVHARTEGYLFDRRLPDTVPLDLYWSSARGDNFTTCSDVGRIDAQRAGYASVRTEGFLFSSQQPGTVPLKLFWSAERGDNFVTATEQGERDALHAGYASVRVEGYLFPRVIALRASNGQYVGAVNGGGSSVDARRPRIREHEVFEVVYLDRDRIALRTHSGYYLCAEGGGGREMVANRTWIGDWEQLAWVRVDGNRVAIRVHRGQFVCAEGGGGRELVANRTRVDRWETFEIVAV